MLGIARSIEWFEESYHGQLYGCSVLLSFLFTDGARHRMLTGGSHEAVEVSHRRVVDEGVGDHGCGAVWCGMVMKRSSRVVRCVVRCGAEVRVLWSRGGVRSAGYLYRDGSVEVC